MVDTSRGPLSVTDQSARADAPSAEATTDNLATTPTTLTTLAGKINEMLAAARPRLVRLARLQGIASDVADDVAQDALLIAWRSLDHLRSPDSFDAWLDGVTRNVSRRRLRAQQAEHAHVVLLSHRVSANAPIDADADDATGGITADGVESQEEDTAVIGDLGSGSGADFDLSEELTRQEMVTLLDRALGRLAPGARAAIERCYLAEEPAHEVAARLGLTLNALETRLSRARQDLRRILSGPLRDEAAAFDLALDDEMAKGWRQTRLWCHLCGRHRLIGRIEEQAAGTSMDLRCPDCWQRYGVAEMRFDPHPLLHGLRTFRPAVKRVAHVLAPYALASLRSPAKCPTCGAPARSHLTPGYDVAQHFPERGCFPPFTYLTVECPFCGQSFTSACSIAGWAAPPIRKYMLTQPRWTVECDGLASFDNSVALCSRLVDHQTGARLTFFAHPESLDVLAIFDK